MGRTEQNIGLAPENPKKRPARKQNRTEQNEKSILFCSVLFCSVSFCFVLFRSASLCFVLFVVFWIYSAFSVRFNSLRFCSVLAPLVSLRAVSFWGARVNYRTLRPPHCAPQPAHHQTPTKPNPNQANRPGNPFSAYKMNSIPHAIVKKTSKPIAKTRFLDAAYGKMRALPLRR